LNVYVHGHRDFTKERGRTGIRPLSLIAAADLSGIGKNVYLLYPFSYATGGVASIAARMMIIDNGRTLPS
jgi:hypothetical protein